MNETKLKSRETPMFFQTIIRTKKNQAISLKWKSDEMVWSGHRNFKAQNKFNGNVFQRFYMHSSVELEFQDFVFLFSFVVYRFQRMCAFIQSPYTILYRKASQQRHVTFVLAISKLWLVCVFVSWIRYCGTVTLWRHSVNGA